MKRYQWRSPTNGLNKDGCVRIKEDVVRGAYLLGNFRLVFQWHVDYSLSAGRRDGVHQVSEERRA